MKVEIRQVYKKSGTGLEETYFPLAELFNNAGDFLGSGMIPDGFITVLMFPPKDEDHGHVCFNPLVDPSWLYTKELATGIMLQRGQWY